MSCIRIRLLLLWMSYIRIRRAITLQSKNNFYAYAYRHICCLNSSPLSPPLSSLSPRWAVGVMVPGGWVETNHSWSPYISVDYIGTTQNRGCHWDEQQQQLTMPRHHMLNAKWKSESPWQIRRDQFRARQNQEKSRLTIKTILLCKWSATQQLLTAETDCNTYAN